GEFRARRPRRGQDVLPAVRAAGAPPPLVAVVDDSNAVLAGWRAALGWDALLEAFPSPTAFWRQIAARPGLLAALDVIVIDSRFEGDTDGLDLARAVRARRPEL